MIGRVLTAAVVAAACVGCGPTPQQVRDEGIALYEAGRLAEAHDKLDTAVQVIAYDPPTLYYAGRTAYELGHAERAEFYFHCCLDVDPGHRGARRWLRALQAEEAPPAVAPSPDEPAPGDGP